MATEVILPKLGQTMESGSIAEWLVQEGQAVKKGEPIFTVESDKAVLEATAPASGVLRRILLPKGQQAPVLSRVGIIAKADEDISKLEAAGLAGSGPAAAQVTEQAAPEAAGAAALAGPAEAATGERVVASPRARRLARLEGVDLAGVAGTGPGGRITERDVLACLAAAPKATPAAQGVARALGVDLGSVTPALGERIRAQDVRATTTPAYVAQPAPSMAAAGDGAVERTPLSGIRALVAQRMTESAHTTAAFTLTAEADAGALVAWREMLKRRAREGDRVPTYTDMLVRLAAKALREFPYMNARLEGNEIARYSRINLGIAVDTERSLMVPVLADAGSKSLGEIAAATADLVTRTRKGQATPDDLSGGTFTITNLGMFDVDAFTPIINVPECAILGVGRIAERPAVRDGAIVARPTMVLSLTVDHRVVDGAPAARFLQRLKAMIEEPLLAL